MKKFHLWMTMLKILHTWKLVSCLCVLKKQNLPHRNLKIFFLSLYISLVFSNFFVHPWIHLAALKRNKQCILNTSMSMPYAFSYIVIKNLNLLNKNSDIITCNIFDLKCCLSPWMNMLMLPWTVLCEIYCINILSFSD